MTSVAAASSSRASRGPAAASSSSSLDDQLAALLTLPDKSHVVDNNNKETAAYFSMAAYLNLALGTTTNDDGDNDNDDDALQQRMAELALQLQLQTQACHEDIGRIGAELQAILPRCHADVGRLSVGLQGLQQDAATLLQVTSSSSTGSSATTANPDEAANASSSLETLSTLHALQAHLQRTHEILTAAATWDSTLAEIPPLLAAATETTASQTLPAAVQKLALLEQGEQALRGMPQQEERTAAITKFRVQISHLLAPQLQHALQSMSSRLGPLQQCVSLYSQLDQLPALVKEYVSSRPQHASLHKTWFDYTPPPVVDDDDADAEALAFGEWLPTWYEAVLQLLHDERRQAAAVFGASHVPTLLALVLQETFAPRLLQSFGNRMPAVTGSQLNVVVNHLYKATLQFVAAAYETIAASWLDWMESTTGTTTGAAEKSLIETTTTTTSGGGSSQEQPLVQDGVALYRQLMDIFAKICSPFAAYHTLSSWQDVEQAQAEESYMAQWVPAVQAAVPNSTAKEMDLNDLVHATDGLLALAQNHDEQYLLATAHNVLGRLEWLHGGFYAAEACRLLDESVSQNVNLLVSTVQQRLSSNNNNLEYWATAFDEPHVLAALQVLKVAAVCQRLVTTDLQVYARQRLTALAERLRVVVARHAEIMDQQQQQQQSSSAGASSSSSNNNTFATTFFLLPDALSPLELSAQLCLNRHGDAAAAAEADAAVTVLQRLATAPPGVLLEQATASLQQLVTASHLFVFTVCAAVPTQQLQTMTSLSTWKKGTPAAAAVAEESYGTLPQGYITQVGEHMLALVQALEPFAAEKETNLKLANQVMDQVQKVAEQPWKDFVRATGYNAGSSYDDASNLIIPQLMTQSKELKEFVIGGDENNNADDEEEEEEEDVEDKEVAAFCNAWLDVVGLAVTGLLLERILHIPQLSPQGCEHLVVDLNYLQNVLVALGVTGHPHVLLGHVAHVVALPVAELQERVRRQKSAAAQLPVVQAALVAMEERLAAMKGTGS